MKIVIDGMGGDNAPLEIVRGTINAAHARLETAFVLVGRENDLRAAAETCGGLPGNVSLWNATEVIDMHDDPASAFKTKKDSSITVGMNRVKAGEGDAFVSAGSTGALLAAGTLLIKRVKGIRRVAMAPVLPTAGKGTVLIDCGANAECTVEYLLQFAYLGSFYAEKALGIAQPQVGLLNIGTEDTKGDPLRLETYQALQAASAAGRLYFIGNIEAHEALRGRCDVIVTDGFSGNILLKTLEGTAAFLGEALKEIFFKGGSAGSEAVQIKEGIDTLKKRMSSDSIGGTPFLGLTKPVIKAHGHSGAAAIENAIYQAVKAVEMDLASQIAQNIHLMQLTS